MITERKTILAIDMSAIFYMAHHATADAPLSEAKKITLETIARIQRLVNADATVVCCDSKTNWRKKLDPSYKAQREKQPATFYGEMQRVKDRLTADGMLLYECDGYEADDLLATLCWAPDTRKANVVIASPDKDLLQLVLPDDRGGIPGGWVKQLRTHDMLMPDGQTPKLWDDVAVTEYLGVPPHKVADYLAIVGDKIDNINGIPDVGGKGAAALLAEYGSLEMVITNYDSNRESPFERKTLNRWRKPLVTYFQHHGNVENLRRNRVLTGLKTDAPLDVTQIFAERKPQPLTRDDEQESQSGGFEMPVIDANFTQDVKPTPEPEKQTALAIPSSNPLDQFNAALQPTGMHALWWLAKRAIDARLYDKFSSPEQALMVMLRGVQDFGLSPSGSMELLNVVKGRVCPPASLLISRAKAHEDCEYFYCKEKSPTMATFVTKNKRNPQETSVTYTIEMAKKAGLYKAGGAWDAHGERMCVKMAGAFLAREEYPSTALGSYAIEEMETA